MSGYDISPGLPKTHFGLKLNRTSGILRRHWGLVCYRLDLMDSDTIASIASTERRLALFQYMFRHSRSQVGPQQFYQAFVGVLVEVFRADAVCIWTAQSGKLCLTKAAMLDVTGLAPNADNWRPHEQLLEAVALRGGPLRVAPSESTVLGVNPLDFELLLVPLISGASVLGLVELFRAVPINGMSPEADNSSPDENEATAIELGDLRSWCEFLQDYLRSREQASQATLTLSEAALRTFAMRLHTVQVQHEAALVAVNEGRQAIGCERVSLGWAVGRRTKLLATSGHETINERSNVVQALIQLTKVAIQSGEALNFRFPPPKSKDAATAFATNSETNATASVPLQAQVPPEVYRTAMEAYPSEERPQRILVVPMVHDSKPKTGATKRRGALIVEQFRSDSLSDADIQRAVLVAEQVRVALQRTELLASIPFLAFWKRTTETTWLRRCWQLALLLLFAAGVVALVTVPMEMRLSSDGELLCESRRTVFAAEDGIVREILVRHGDTLDAGQKVLVLDNLELTARHRELSGQLLQTRERQRSLEASRSGQRLTEREQLTLQTGLGEAAVAITHIEQQLQRMQERIDRLVVLAPEAGVVTSWNLDQSLLHRPVRQGDALFQQIDPSGRWAIELNIVEDRSGYVARRMSELAEGEKLTVDFVLATDAETRFTGTLRELASRTDITAAGHIVRAIIDLDPAKPPPLRDGTEVNARLNCGPRPIGFVLFRELIEVLYTYLWY